MSEAASGTATDQEVRYGFNKIFVDDLSAMARFYEHVFGLKSFNQSQGKMMGHTVEEINYQAPEGAAQLSLIKWLDAPTPAPGGGVLGFVSTDIEQTVRRAEAAGASVPHPIERIDDYGIYIAFIRDPEGNISEIVQPLAG